jgi:hypothetical protein
VRNRKQINVTKNKNFLKYGHDGMQNPRGLVCQYGTDCSSRACEFKHPLLHAKGDSKPWKNRGGKSHEKAGRNNKQGTSSGANDPENVSNQIKNDHKVMQYGETTYLNPQFRHVQEPKALSERARRQIQEIYDREYSEMDWAEMSDEEYHSRNPRFEPPAQKLRVNKGGGAIKEFDIRRPQSSHSEPMRTIEFHAKVSDQAIRKNLVKMMAGNNDIAWGYVLSADTVICPHHYTGVTGIRYKFGAGWRDMQCSLITTLRESNLDGIDVYALQFKGIVPFSSVPLGIPPNSFPGILLAPGFLQVGGINTVDGMLQYRAESVRGDCGQVMVDGETGNVVGLHVAKDKCSDKVGLGVPFTPTILGKLKDFQR